MSLPEYNQLPPYTKRARRDHIAAAVLDLIGDFLYYDRKESESLPRDSIQEAVAAREVTIDEICELFSRSLRASLKEPA